MTLLLCAALPLIAAAIIALAGDRVGRRGGVAISSAALVLAFGASVAIGQAFAAGKSSLVAELGPWLPLRGGDIALVVVPTTLPVLIATTLVSAAIAVASWRVRQTRAYQLAILLGTAALVLVATAGNLALFTAAFGLLGAATYIALSHDHERAAAAAGAERALVVDRLGDGALLLATVGYLALFRTLDLAEIETRVVATRVADITFIGPSVFLCAGILAKSAQLPFQARATALREAPLGLATFGALAFAANAVALTRVSFLVHPGVLAAAAALGTLSALLAVVLAATRADGRAALAWIAIAPAGIEIVTIGAGASEMALTIFVVTAIALTSLTAIAAIGRPHLRWRGAGPARARRALADGFGFLAVFVAVARGYGAIAKALEDGTDASLDRLLGWVAAATLRAGRIVAHAEAGPAWRVEAIGVAALIAFVAYWGLR